MCYNIYIQYPFINEKSIYFKIDRKLYLDWYYERHKDSKLVGYDFVQKYGKKIKFKVTSKLKKEKLEILFLLNNLNIFIST